MGKNKRLIIGYGVSIETISMLLVLVVLILSYRVDQEGRDKIFDRQF